MALSHEEAWLEAERHIKSDPIRFKLFNPAQIRAIRALRETDLAVLCIIMGNGSGKTYGLTAILSAIMFGTNNPLFASIPIIRNWPYPKSARICAPPTLLEDRGPIQEGIKQLFPEGQYAQSRGVGKGYYSHGETNTGWDWDIMSYNQSAREAAGHTKGLVAFSEPPPYDFFTEVVSRTRGQGLVIIECTPLNYAAWIKEELIDPGALKLNGKPVGKVITVKGDIWDNCNIHQGGQLSEEAIKRQIALWPAEEREAREKGLFMHLAGRVYTHWGDGNELDKLPAWHQENWDVGRVNLVQVMDPHDRKPWAIAWFAVFPNDDVIAIAEWPPFSFKDTVTSPVFDPEEYREIILSAEEEVGKRANNRLIDPNFGNSPKDIRTGKTIVQMLGGNCRGCKAPTCSHSLNFENPPDSIPEGHTLVRRAIGDQEKGLRPKIYALKESCPNFCYGMRHYGYRENRDHSKGVSEKPELIHKDFSDLVRYLYLAGFGQYSHRSEKEADLWRKRPGRLLG